MPEDRPRSPASPEFFHRAVVEGGGRPNPSPGGAPGAAAAGRVGGQRRKKRSFSARGHARGGRSRPPEREAPEHKKRGPGPQKQERQPNGFPGTTPLHDRTPREKVSERGGGGGGRSPQAARAPPRRARRGEAPAGRRRWRQCPGFRSPSHRRPRRWGRAPRRVFRPWRASRGPTHEATRRAGSEVALSLRPTPAPGFGGKIAWWFPPACNVNWGPHRRGASTSFSPLTPSAPDGAPVHPHRGRRGNLALLVISTPDLRGFPNFEGRVNSGRAAETRPGGAPGGRVLAGGHYAYLR